MKRNRWKRVLTATLLFIMIIIQPMNTYAAWSDNAIDFIDKYGEKFALYEENSFWFGQWGTRNGTLKYRIIGWQISVGVNGKNYMVHSRIGNSTKLVDERMKPGTDKLYTLWKVDYNDIVDKLIKKYPNDDFSELADRTVTSRYRFDAIMTTGYVQSDGSINNNGDIDDNGNTTWGKVYYDYNGIVNAAPWPDYTREELAKLYNIASIVHGANKPPTNPTYTPINSNLDVIKYDYKESDSVYWVKPGSQFQIYTDGYLESSSFQYPDRNILNLYPNGSNSDYGVFATISSGSNTDKFPNDFTLNASKTRAMKEYASTKNYLKSNFYMSAKHDNKDYLLNYLSQWKGMNGPYINSGKWMKTDGTAPTVDSISQNRTESKLTITSNNVKDHGRSGNKQLKYVVYETQYASNISKHNTVVKNISGEGINVAQDFNSSNVINFNKYADYTIEIWTKDNVGNEAKRHVVQSIGKRKNYITVEHRDKDNNNLIAKNQVEVFAYDNQNATIQKKYSAQSIYMYNFSHTKIIEGGNTVVTNAGSSVTINSKAQGENKVIFYYSKKSNPDGDNGTILFKPHETNWTNSGKINEGKGSYPVTVEYVGEQNIKFEGSAVIVHDEPLPDIKNQDGTVTTQANLIYEYHVYFDVIYSLKNMKVTGSATSTINGRSGVVNLTTEGQGLQLFAEGSWNDAKYTLPGINKYEYIKSTHIPNPPPIPRGTSGYYNLDWKRTDINLNKTPMKEWIKSPVPYNITVDISDNLSGFADNEKIVVTDFSHYSNNAEQAISSNKINHISTVELTDGIYKLDIKADDIAGNKHSKTYETFYIDGNSPEISFNINNKIFSEENGAIRKPSILGEGDAYYGKITASDNLSGLKSIDYKWTYGKDKPADGYTNIYSSDTTFTDRHDEVVELEIEKPVGDNLFLHLQLYDVAGNYTYKSYGPYEDPIMLKNFEITDIRDPLWTSVFWNDDKYKEHSGRTFGVDELAIDEEAHPTLKNALPKKGYAFYFNLTSEYLYRGFDEIQIKPTFYYLKDGDRMKVDCYYNNNNNPLVGFGTELDDSAITLYNPKYGDVLIGGFSELILTKGVRAVKGREWDLWENTIQYIDGKEQWWYGKYFIPATTFCVKEDESPRPENKLTGGSLLVNFEVIAYKNGAETLSTNQEFTYNLSQWETEGGPKNSSYSVGDVILYNTKYGADSNNDVRVIH